MGIVGKEVTPFLLKEITNITKGKSLATNIELIKNNAL
jgi:pseudouridine-5'-phosphate glycosidase